MGSFDRLASGQIESDLFGENFGIRISNTMGVISEVHYIESSIGYDHRGSLVNHTRLKFILS